MAESHCNTIGSLERCFTVGERNISSRPISFTIGSTYLRSEHQKCTPKRLKLMNFIDISII
jgi:hypothetical protein